MKKFLIGTVLVLGFAGLLLAGAWTDVGKYKEYLTVRAMASEADSAGNTTISVAKYKEAANLAANYATAEIQAWQLNSAAYSLIKVFKETREKSLLVEAMELLEDAKALNAEKVMTKIQSNIDFCQVWLEIK
jgi:hypothetical protein